MQIEAFPVEFVALSDGVLGGREHVVLFLEHVARREPHGFALSLADARRLLDALTAVLPSVQKIQARILEGN